MGRAYLVDNLTTHIFLQSDQPTIPGRAGCGRRLRDRLRLIAHDDSVKSPPLLTARSSPLTSDCSPFRRNYRRASVPDRSDARQQPVACPASSEPGHADRHDALLRPDPRGGGPPVGCVAVARASPPDISAGCCACHLGLASRVWTPSPACRSFGQSCVEVPFRGTEPLEPLEPSARMNVSSIPPRVGL